mgnify:CR=1 FL=1|jgi:hypothetical protein|tara:strand:+ start:149 stop:451 length:303 start_codon:yes stop_codon:yes gene_type:complete
MPKGKTDEIKFTEEELEKIKEFQQKYLDIQMGFGQADITGMRLDVQIDNLDAFKEDLRSQFSAVQEDEREFIQEINERYGDGVLDPASGVFTPNKEVQTS